MKADFCNLLSLLPCRIKAIIFIIACFGHFYINLWVALLQEAFGFSSKGAWINMPSYLN